MSAGLIPSISTLLQAVHFGVVLGLICGVGFLTGAKRPEVALFTGWGVMCVVAVVFGGLYHADLVLVMYGLGLVGLIGLARQSVYWRRIEWGLVPYVAVLALPLILSLLSFHTTAYDDFAFWGPNLVALCETGHFPSLLYPLTTSAMPDYPRAVALVSFATYLFNPDSSPTGLIRILTVGPWWNITLLLAVASALGGIIEARFTAARVQLTSLQRFGIAGLAILLQSFLCPGFIPKMTLSNMGDASTASGLALLIALIFALFHDQSARPSRQIFINLALTASAISFIRQDNLGILAILPVIVWLLAKNQGRSWLQAGFVTIFTCLPAVVTHLLWGHYVTVNLGEPSHSLLPTGQWHWGLFYHDTLHAVTKTLLAKGAYTAFAFGFVLALVFVGLGKWRPEKPAQKLLVVITVLVFWNAFFIMFAYLATNFSASQVKTAIGYWRFLAQTGPAETVALACIVPVGYIGHCLGRRLCVGLGLIASLVPIAILPTRWSFRNDLHSAVPAFLDMGIRVSAMLPAGAPMLIYDVSDGSGFAGWLIKFGLLDLGRTQHAVTLTVSAPPAVAALPASDQYIVVTTGRHAVSLSTDLTLSPWHAYLVRVSASHPTALLTQAITPYR